MRSNLRSAATKLLSLFVLCALGFAAVSSVAAQDQTNAALGAAIDGPQRGSAHKARDIYRHPYETLTFLGVTEQSHVVEIWPGAEGYWTEILAPYLREHGLYIAAGLEASQTADYAQKDIRGFKAKLDANPAIYDKVEVTEFAGDKHEIAPPGSADVVLTFRNLHNWLSAGEAPQAFAAFYKALKPGGILGIEDHRGRTDQPQDPQAKSGYVRQDYAIELAEKAGFKFVASSEINANPKDTKDYPAGVWTLPPVYKLKDQDREKYTAIGESDRFLLKFVKPAAQ